MAPKNPKDGSVPGNNTGDNLQWLCPTCNGTKSNISPEQYYNFNLAPGGAIVSDRQKANSRRVTTESGKRTEARSSGER